MSPAATPATQAGLGAPAFRETPAVTGGEFAWSLAAPVLVLALAAAALLWMKRSGWRPRWSAMAFPLPPAAAIEVLERKAITPLTRLILVRVEGQTMLVTESSARATVTPLGVASPTDQTRATKA